jgi:uncharacterized protein YlxW (UPF0749 family)
MNKKATDKVPFRVSDDAGGLSTSTAKNLKEKIDDMDDVIKAVIVVLIVMVATMLIATLTLYLDQAHFNEDTYKEESGSFQSQLDASQNKATTLQSQVNTLNAEVKALQHP